MNLVSGLLEYKMQLIIEGFLLKEEDLEQIKNNEQLQKFYLSTYFLNCLKNFVKQNQRTSFIDLFTKRKLLNYLNLFRDINKNSNSENKKQLLQLINECIIECNMLEPKTDSDIYLTTQIYIRTSGIIDLERCYNLIKFCNYGELVKASNFYDLYYFDQYVLKPISIEKDVSKALVSEWALWSVTRFLNDLDILKNNSIFIENCVKLTDICKKSTFRNYLENGIRVGNRIKKENKELIKKLR